VFNVFFAYFHIFEYFKIIAEIINSFNNLDKTKPVRYNKILELYQKCAEGIFTPKKFPPTVGKAYRASK